MNLIKKSQTDEKFGNKLGFSMEEFRRIYSSGNWTDYSIHLFNIYQLL